MSIVRDSETDFTAMLTGTDMAWWLHYNNKMSIQEAVDTVEINKGREFYVRLPLEVKNTDDLIEYIGLSKMIK
jgi:hypothetical protein